MDTLGPKVYAIHLSHNGDLISVSTDPKDDEIVYVYHPPLQSVPPSDRIKTVVRSQLVELDRLSPNVDLVLYTPDANGVVSRLAVFKYYFLFQFLYKV